MNEKVKSDNNYPLAAKYTDMHTIYRECSGPGGLELAEFMAGKMGLRSGMKILDVGPAHGYQTCFLAKEFDVTVVAIDPMQSFRDEQLQIDHVEQNAKAWGVQNKVVGIQVGVPETKLASQSFDAVYSTTALEMIRGFYGMDNYMASLKEIYRLLKPGGIFGLGEPMHHDVPVSEALDPIISQSKDCVPWKEAFETLEKTVGYLQQAGFVIEDSGHADDSWKWWQQYVQYDPDCIKYPDHEDIRALQIDQGQWVSFGYVICKKP